VLRNSLTTVSTFLTTRISISLSV
ncbi:acrB/AcrD/AcrF family protein, partial [Vibrio parahaemolyticus AQ3810]